MNSRLGRMFACGLILMPLWVPSVHAADSTVRLKETLEIASEAALLSGASVSESSQRLSQLVKTEYLYDIRCESGWFSGPSSPECLIGLRGFARALYRDLLPKLNQTAASILKIRITNANGPELKFSEEALEIDIPYRFSSEEMFMYIMPALQGDHFRKRILMRSKFEEILGNLEANLGNRFQFDHKLTLAEKWTALNNLVSLAQHKPYLLDGPADLFFVTRQGFKPIHEKHLGLHVNLDATADYNAVVFFLSSRAFKDTQRIQRLQEERHHIAELAISLQKKTGRPVECSSAGKLTLLECQNALQNLNMAIDQNPKLKIDAAAILIVGSDEIDAPFDTFEVPGKFETIFAVRNDFNVQSLYNFTLQKGWLS